MFSTLTRRRFLKGATMAGIGAMAAGRLGPALGVEPTELRIGVADLVDESFDPVRANSQRDDLISMLFENIVELDANGAPAPGIVKAWETAPDGLSWTLHLRDDVVFHDGSKVTADDIAFAYQRSVEEDAYENGTWLDMLGKEPKIDVVDPLTVVVHTQGPQPLFLPLSSEYGGAIWVLPKAYFQKLGSDGFSAAPIGTGPYQFVSATSGDSMQFKAVGYKHWRSTPAFTTVTVVLVPDENTRVALLEKGEIDESPVSLESSIALKAKGYQIYTGELAQAYLPIVGACSPSVANAPLADVRVRQALSLAINRQEIGDTMFHGFVSPLSPIRVSYAMPDMTATLRDKWLAWSKKNFRFDPDAAKKLLADAGYPNGFSFEIWSVTYGTAPYLQDLVQAVAGYWEAIGVHATIVNVDQSTWTKSRNSKKSDAAIGKFGSMPSPLAKASAIENLNVFSSQSGSMDTFTGCPDQDAFDKAWDEGMTTLDASRRTELLDQMLQLASASWTSLPLVNTASLYAFGPRVKYVLPRPTGALSHYYADWTYSGQG